MSEDDEDREAEEWLRAMYPPPPAPVEPDYDDDWTGDQLEAMCDQDRSKPRPIFPAAPNIVDDAMHKEIERILRHHHAESNETVTGTHAEEVLRRAAERAGHRVETKRAGNRGYDFVLNDQRISHKSQAGGTIKRDVIAISQITVLYKGDHWGHEEASRDAIAKRIAREMRDDFDRLVVLRAFVCDGTIEYQLVEPPKELLLRAEHGEVKWAEKTKKAAADRTFNVFVRDDGGDLFKLQVEGSRHKVSLGGLHCGMCTVHDKWSIPKGTPSTLGL